MLQSGVYQVKNMVKIANFDMAHLPEILNRTDSWYLKLNFRELETCSYGCLWWTAWESLWWLLNNLPPQDWFGYIFLEKNVHQETWKWKSTFISNIFLLNIVPTPIYKNCYTILFPVPFTTLHFRSKVKRIIHSGQRWSWSIIFWWWSDCITNYRQSYWGIINFILYTMYSNSKNISKVSDYVCLFKW